MTPAEMLLGWLIIGGGLIFAVALLLFGIYVLVKISEWII